MIDDDENINDPLFMEALNELKNRLPNDYEELLSTLENTIHKIKSISSYNLNIKQ